jgi:hypothetical protein
VLASNHLAAIISADDLKSTVTDDSCCLERLDISDNGYFDYVHGRNSSSVKTAEGRNVVIPSAVEENWAGCRVDLSRQQDPSHVLKYILLIQNVWKVSRKKAKDKNRKGVL